MLAVAFATACGKLLGVEDYSVSKQVSAAESGTCTKHADCTGFASDSAGFAPGFCLKATQRCVSLRSTDCHTVHGPEDDDRAIVLGSLFATQGPQAMVNVAREQSAVLAIDELNKAGGLPSASPAEMPRPIVLVACDASHMPLRAAAHLVDALKVPAIVGPNNSQNTLEIAREVSVPGGTLTISPTAVAASIADLRDGDLAWQMVPSDAQRAPLLIYEIKAIERELKQTRQRDLKLGVIVRGDVLGDGTRTALAKLTWNGEPLPELVNRGTTVMIDSYDGDASNQDELVAKYAGFAPDLLVLVGAGEAISGIMAPLEQALPSDAKPEYVLTDSSKVPELLSLAAAQTGLAARLRGTGVTPSEKAVPVNQAFHLSYNARYPSDDQVLSSGMGPSYDATYAIAYAIVAAGGDVNGHDVARGLQRLGRGEEVPLGPAHILSAFRHLSSGESIAAVGTYSSLAWDDRGAVSAGAIEIWCVELVNGGQPVFTSSGVTADIPQQTLHGENRRCRVQAQREPRQSSTTSGTLDAGVHQLDAATHAPSPDAAMPDESGPVLRPRADAGTASTSPKPIPCGPLECQRARDEYCCIAAIRPFGSFETDYSCETASRSCAAKLRCTSDHECEHGTICCRNSQLETHCVAATDCGESEQRMACDAPVDCPNQQECCLEPGNDAYQWSSQCLPSCQAGPIGTLRMCSRQSHCSTPNGCQRLPELPAVGTCL